MKEQKRTRTLKQIFEENLWKKRILLKEFC